MNILAFFTSNGSPTLGLSPTIRIRNVSTNAIVVSDQLMTEVGDGHYKYDFVNYDKDIDYAIRCDGGISLSDSDRYTYAGNENYIDDISETITESTSADFSTLNTGIEEVNDNVLAASASIVEDLVEINSNVIFYSSETNTKIDSLSASSGENFDELNTNVLGVSAQGEVTHNLLGTVISNQQAASGSDVAGISTKIDSLSASNQDNFDIVNQNIADVNTNVLAVSGSLVVISNDIKRLLGLTHENIFIDNPVYDSHGNLTSARVRIYSNPASVGTLVDVIGTYTIAAPSTAPGQFTTWSQVRA